MTTAVENKTHNTIDDSNLSEFLVFSPKLPTSLAEFLGLSLLLKTLSLPEETVRQVMSLAMDSMNQEARHRKL